MESEAIVGVFSVQKVKGLIILELNGLDSRFNKTRFLNVDDPQKVMLHNLIDLIKTIQFVLAVPHGGSPV